MCLFFLLQASVPALAYLSIGMVIMFVVGFATGPGSIPWFFVTELFNQSGRPIATSIAVVTNWSANFLVGLGFSPLQVKFKKTFKVHSTLRSFINDVTDFVTTVRKLYY